MTTLPRQSLAAVTTAPNIMEMRRLDIPEIGDDEAIVKIEATGICGTDYEWFRGDLDIPFPIILGHEPLGRIAAIGSQPSVRRRLSVGASLSVIGWRCAPDTAADAARPVPPAATNRAPTVAVSVKPGWTAAQGFGADIPSICTCRPGRWYSRWIPPLTRRWR